jgi:steroid delta-isomerase-like uncharacterized protein
VNADDMKRIQTGAWKAVEIGSLDWVDEFFHENAVSHQSDGDLVGTAAMKEFTAALYAAFSDFEVHVDDLVVEADKVAFRVTLSCTHTGEFQGVPASGNRVTVGALGISRIEGGKIAEQWEQLDGVSLLQQIGAL